MRAASPEPETITISSIIHSPDREVRNDNSFTLRERIVMLLENVRDDESVTPDERNNIFSVLGISHNGQENSIEDLLSTRQTQQAREAENTVSQPVRRRNTPNRSR